MFNPEGENAIQVTRVNIFDYFNNNAFILCYVSFLSVNTD